MSIETRASTCEDESQYWIVSLVFNIDIVLILVDNHGKCSSTCSDVSDQIKWVQQWMNSFDRIKQREQYAVDWLFSMRFSIDRIRSSSTSIELVWDNVRRVHGFQCKSSRYSLVDHRTCSSLDQSTLIVHDNEIRLYHHRSMTCWKKKIVSKYFCQLSVILTSCRFIEHSRDELSHDVRYRVQHMGNRHSRCVSIDFHCHSVSYDKRRMSEVWHWTNVKSTKRRKHPKLPHSSAELPTNWKYDWAVAIWSR
jgi:hypothetical protein